jgi:hypothetical protein
MTDAGNFMADTIPAKAAPRRRQHSEYRMIAAPTDPKHTLLPARAIAAAEGYVMVRRPNAHPFIVTEQDWADAPVQERGTKS